MNLYDEKTNMQIGLPTGLDDFRGTTWYVLDVSESSGGGKSGKVRASTPDGTDTRYFYPDVFGCYIADEPRGGES